MKNIIARLNPRMFAAACMYMANKDVRYYLCGVAIQPHPEKGVYILGCNGHVLIVMHDEHGYVDQDRIISIADKTMIKALGGKKDGTLFISEKASWFKECEIGEKASEQSSDFFENPPKRYSLSSLIEGKYPDWTKVIPTQEALLGTYSLPPIRSEYFELVGKTAALLTGSDYSAVFAYPQESAGNSIIFRLGGIGCSDTLITVMPVYAEPYEPVIPPVIYEAKAVAIEKAEREQAEADRLKAEEAAKPKIKPRMRLTNGEWVAMERVLVV